MRERGEIVLPAEHGKNGEHYVLPPYVTLVWYSGVVNQMCEAEVHPDRVNHFKQNQREIEKGWVIWESGS